MSTTHALDSALNVLPRALDTAWMSGRLNEAGVDGTLVAASVLAHTPAKRAVVRYVLRSADGAHSWLIGKLYADRARAVRVHGVMTTVHALMTQNDGLAAPEPLALLRDAGMVLQAAVAGTTLDHLPKRARLDAVRSAARWLGVLHASRIPLERSVDPTSEARKADERAARLAAADARLATPAEQLRGALAATMITAPSLATPLHRDFHYQHVVLSGRFVTVIDLDEMRGGDAAIDVAHFCAYLRLLNIRQRGSATDAAALEAAFLTAYSPAAGYAIDARHRFHFANTCLKIADQLVRGRGPEPVPASAESVPQAASLLEEGRRCLDA